MLMTTWELTELMFCTISTLWTTLPSRSRYCLLCDLTATGCLHALNLSRYSRESPPATMPAP